jgi:hypothetical protein
MSVDAADQAFPSGQEKVRLGPASAAGQVKTLHLQP